MEQYSVAIEQSTGEPYGGCPWQAFEDPMVSAVVQAYPWFEKGELSTLVGPAPSARFLEGFDLYRRTVQKLQADEADKRAKADAKNAQAPKQTVVRRG